jgi:hypothetical protein
MLYSYLFPAVFPTKILHPSLISPPNYISYFLFITYFPVLFLFLNICNLSLPWQLRPALFISLCHSWQYCHADWVWGKGRLITSPCVWMHHHQTCQTFPFLQLPETQCALPLTRTILEIHYIWASCCIDVSLTHSPPSLMQFKTVPISL